MKKHRSFTLMHLCFAALALLILDFGAARATAEPSPSIREGSEHLHNVLLDHAVALEDINSDLRFASVRHLYATHPNSVVHDATKQAEREQIEKATMSQVARSTDEADLRTGSYVVLPTRKLFLGPFTGTAIRALAGLASLAANSVCKFLDRAFKDKSHGQVAGVAACYIGANLLGVYGLFSAGHNLYKIQQAGQRVQAIADTTNQAFQLATVAGGGARKRDPANVFERESVNVTELMEDEFETHQLAVRIAEMGHRYEAAGLLSTIRPVALLSSMNQTSHLWQEYRNGQIAKTHVLTRLNVQITSAGEEKRDVCEDSDNEAGDDPQARLCSVGANEGFTGIYDSFDMFNSESDFEVVHENMGDSEYADDVARGAGDLMDLGNTSGVCMYPRINNQVVLTILSALEFRSRPSKTYSACPSI